MKRKNVRLTAIISIVAIFIVMVVGGAFLVSYEVKQQVKQMRVASYRVTNIEKVITQPLSDRIILQQLELTDTTGSGKIVIGELEIKGFHIRPFLFHGKREFNRITITDARITIITDPAGKPKSKSPGSAAKGKAIAIGKLELIHTRFVIGKTSTKNPDSLFSTNLNMEIRGINTGKSDGTFHYKNTSFERIRMNLEKGQYILSDQPYRFRYDQLSYDSENQKIAVNRLKLVSNDPKYEIGRKEGVETDWLNLVFNTLELKGIRLNSLLNDKVFIATEGRIKKFTVDAFRDKRLPTPEKPDTKLPMETINTLPFAFHCDSFLIDQAGISYAERVENSEKAGEVHFSRLKVRIKNISNIDSLINGPTTMHASAYIMDGAKLNADFTFPNKKYPVAYQVKGHMGSMPFTSFNPIAQYNTGIFIEEGHIDRIDFDFDYTDDQATGNLLFEYQDLKVSFLDQDDGSKEKLKSFLVNSLILTKQNQGEKVFSRQGKISFDRDKKKSVFNYWWKAIFSGIKNIAVL